MKLKTPKLIPGKLPRKAEQAVIVIILMFSLVWIVLGIPYLLPSDHTVDEYPWYWLGVDSIKNELWDAEMEMFRESPNYNASYWIDDNAKLLNAFLESPRDYSENITNIIELLNDVGQDGYFPRRYVSIKPEFTNNDTTNMTMQNGFLRLTGNLSDPLDISDPLRMQYYEASGHVDFGFLAGQLFTIYEDSPGAFFNWITYDPIRAKADQIQNPGFDANGSAGVTPYIDLLPWAFSYPVNWSYSNDPPIICLYDTRFANDDPGSHYRVVGLNVSAEGSEHEWRSDKFAVGNATLYSISFDYRGNYTGGTEFRVYVRWFNESDVFISETFVGFDFDTALWTNIAWDDTSPATAAKADIRIVSYSDTIGSYFFDDFAVGSAPVPNPSVNIPDDYNFRTDVYHSMNRSLHLYDAHDYGMQYLYRPTNVSQFLNLTYWVKTGAATNFSLYVWYNDGSFDNVSMNHPSTDWMLGAIHPANLTANKIVRAFAFDQLTPSIDVFIDDVAFNYKPINATFTASVKADVYPVRYTEAIQRYDDADLNLTVRFRFADDQAYLTQSMDVANKGSQKIGVYLHNAFDGLSTIISGNGSQATAYSSVWIPNIGRRFPDPDEYITTLFSLTDVEEYWNLEHGYFVAELKQIPEWSGCLGLMVQVPVNFMHDIINTRSLNTSIWGSDTGKYLHYLTYSFEFDVAANGNATLSTKTFCLNGYDFTQPGIYDRYLDRLDDYDGLDLSMNYHIGMIDYVLSKYALIKRSDPYDMAKKTWRYYQRCFSDHDNGSYLMTTGKMIEASLNLYELFGDAQYLDFAKNLSDYLVTEQIASGSLAGNIPMKHNNVTYLDTQCVSLMALKEMRDYSIDYGNAYFLGLDAIHFDYQPSGYTRIPTGGVGSGVPDVKRLFVYANMTHIDDDFWTYKASYTARAALDVNDTLTMIAMSRVWKNTIWNETKLFVFNSESIPNRTITGITPDLNSETQPWALITWLDMAETQQAANNYYYEFLMEHNYIFRVHDLDAAHLNVSIHTGGKGAISLFYLESAGRFVKPEHVFVDGVEIRGTENVEDLDTIVANRYFHDADLHLLALKSYPTSGDYVEIYVIWTTYAPEQWNPILPFIGTFGAVMMMVGVVTGAAYIKTGRYTKAFTISFLILFLGAMLIIGWIFVE